MKIIDYQDTQKHKKRKQSSQMDILNSTKLIKQIVKQRNESAKIYKEQNRDELAEIEDSQSKIISEYLPDQLNEEELITIIDEVIISTGAESIKDMGKVIGATNVKVLGRAEGRVIADLVKSKLNSL